MQYGWSCDLEQWASVRRALTGRAWFVSRYAAGYENSIPQRPGLYMIVLSASETVESAPPWDTMQAPVYIGKSENLRRRFIEHVYNRSHVGQYVNNLPKLKYLYCPADKKELSQVESHLVQVFGPRVNRVQPTVFRATLGPPVGI